MNTIAVIDNNNNFMYTTCGIPNEFREATSNEIIVYENKLKQKSDLIQKVLDLWSTLSLYLQHSNASIKQAILNYIQKDDYISLKLLANDTTVPIEFQDFQKKLAALLGDS
jgi:hypothetical protein